MKDKICNICKLTIDTNKEFAKFMHMKNDTEIRSKAYYHVECFGERMRGTKEVSEVKNEALSLIKGAKKLMGITDEVVYV